MVLRCKTYRTNWFTVKDVTDASVPLSDKSPEYFYHLEFKTTADILEAIISMNINYFFEHTHILYLYINLSDSR